VLQRAYLQLPQSIQRSWIWWRLPIPEAREQQLIDILEENPTGVKWHSPEQTQRLLDLMDENNLAKVRWAQQQHRRIAGTIYKRIRKDKSGQRHQRAELRLDGVSGCLRTARGGSSRQIVMIIEGDRIRSRLISPREGARLMGLPDSYKLPEKYNEAFNLLGDGLAVPVISWLERFLLGPLASSELPLMEQVSDRIEVFAAEQFLATNLHELSAFQVAQREATLQELIKRYNNLIETYETDPGLKIQLG
jgi:DNA (cytosine-5)-methyltransferase 1